MHCKKIDLKEIIWNHTHIQILSHADSRNIILIIGVEDSWFHWNLCKIKKKNDKYKNKKITKITKMPFILCIKLKCFLLIF